MFDFGQFPMSAIFWMLDFGIKKEKKKKKKKTKKERKQFGWGNQHSPCLGEGVAAEGRRRFHRNAAYARLSGFKQVERRVF